MIMLLLQVSIVAYFGAWAHAEAETGEHDLLTYFKLAIGENRLFAHVSNNDDLVFSTRQQWELIQKESKQAEDSSRSPPSHHYLACTGIENTEFRDTLSQSLGSDNFYPIYQSIQTSTVCFLLHCPLSAVVAVSRQLENVDLKMLSPIPSTLKVNHIAVAAIDMIAGLPVRTFGTIPTFKKLSSKSFDKIDLVISFDLGNGAVKTKSDSALLHKAVKSSLSAMNIASLNEMQLFHGGASVWSESHAELRLRSDLLSSLGAEDLSRNKDRCFYSSLKFEERSNGLSIGGLHNIVRAPSAKACFANILAVLAMHNEILDITIRPHDKTLNAIGKAICQSASTTSTNTPYTNAGLNGTGQIVGVGDSGLDDLHCFFINSDGSPVTRTQVSSANPPNYPVYRNNRKIVQYFSYADGKDTADGHGSHVCGTLAGDDESDSLFSKRGHAAGAKISFFDMSTDGNSITYPPPLSTYVFSPVLAAGGYIHSDSWGSSLNTYSSIGADIDNYLYNQDSFLAIFAAGNDGSEGFFSIGDPANAKNLLAIGASTSTSAFGSIAYFSSLGPTFDMRYKPDIMAPGFYTSSTKAVVTEKSCGVHDSAGTSMATPAVAGNAAVIRQFFQDKKFWAKKCNVGYTLCKTFSPRGATVKAVLINSADKMLQYYGNTDTVENTQSLSSTPDFYQGFGRVLLSNTIPLQGTTPSGFDLFVDEITMASLERRTYGVSVTGSSAALRVTIVWMDPPSSVYTSKALIHDIDLKITTPDGETIYGNQFAGDEVNNVEQVVISDPASGTYTVALTAKNILTNSVASTQKVSVVITSVGSVISSSQSVVSATEAYYPLNCPPGQSQLSTIMIDHSTDGWGSGNSYSIMKTSDLSSIWTGALSDPTKGDFWKKETFCIPDGQYSASLTLGVASTAPSDVGYSIPACGVYLDKDTLTQTFSISGNTCGACNKNKLTLTLVGSKYGVPYGWVGTSSYTVYSADVVPPSTPVNIVGTLQMGITDTRTHCIQNGTYNISFLDVPLNDDFNYQAADDGVKLYGIEEYQIQFRCGSSAVTLRAYVCQTYQGQPVSCVRTMQLVNIRLEGGVCTVNYYARSSLSAASSTISKDTFSLIYLFVGSLIMGNYLFF